jgi:outer membrane protein OmpA-like peptidoglycan-associated protein
VQKLQGSFTVGGNVDIGLSFRPTDGSPLVMLTPEASITFPLSEIRKDATWHLTRVMVGASLKFDISSPPAAPQEIIVQREPEAPKPIGRIAAQLQLSGVIDSAGTEREVPNLQLRVDEIEQIDRFPLLNSVFFDHGQSTLPVRYKRLTPSQVDSFAPQQLAALSDLERYRQILNVFGRRMRMMPDTKVTLIGAAPREAAGAIAASNAKTLGLERAKVIKDYLVSTWGIDPSRLTVEQHEFPPNPSTTGTPEGVEENDRVVLSTDDMRLLTPIRMVSVERSLNIPKLRIRTTYTSRFPLNLYSLSLTQGDQVLAQFNSAHDVQDWTPTATQLPSTNEPLAITLSLRDSVGTTFIARDSVLVEQLTVKRKREERVLDRIVERYNLVTFDFDKAELDARSHAIVDTIARHVSAGDRIKLRGYTDLLGDPAHNLLLSENRAKAVTEALKEAIGPDLAKTVSIDAAGEGRANLVDNRFPEGRFLSRTVQITIARPTQ